MERRLPGIEGTARVFARGNDGSEVVAVGQSLQDRDDTLANLVASFAIGGPIAVVLASLLGYALAAAGLRPVEAMRRRAEEVSLGSGDERLPLPAAHDEIRRLGETLNEMLDRLGRSFERERRFVADASHELRTPLAVIKAELEGALRAGGHDPQVREALVASVEECDHLAQLAEDLLVVARTGEGELPMRPERLDVGEQLERVRRRFADRAERARPRHPSRRRRRGGRARRRAAPAPGARQPGRQRAAPRTGRDRAAVAPRAGRRGGRGLGPGRGLRPRLRRPCLRALRPRRSRPHPSRHRPRALDRPHDRGGPRRPCRGRGGRGRNRAHLAPGRLGNRLSVISDRGRTFSSRGDQLDTRGRDRMRDKLKGAVIAAVAIVALAIGGAAIAGAAGGGDDDGTDKAISGQALDHAKAVALEHTGGGKVTGTEAGDEEGAYEVEVVRADGTQVDVHLDKSFHVIDSSADGTGDQGEGGQEDGD